MLSFRKSRGGVEAELEAADHALELLMQGISLHAVEGDTAEHKLFRDQVDSAIKQFEQDRAHRRLITTGSILKLLEHYNRYTSRFYKKQAGAQQQMVALLSKTLVDIGAANNDTAAQMSQIYKSLEKASNLDDIQELKFALTGCMKEIEKERERQTAESQGVIEELRTRLEAINNRTREAVPREPHIAVDPVTELPGPQAAREALELASADPAGTFIGVFVPNRLRAINARHGYGVGDRLLITLRNKLQEKVSKADQLFRWRGPCIIVLLHKRSSLLETRTEIAEVGNLRLQETIEIGSRFVLLPLSFSWEVLPFNSTMDELVSHLDEFVAGVDPC